MVLVGYVISRQLVVLQATLGAERRRREQTEVRRLREVVRSAWLRCLHNYACRYGVVLIGSRDCDRFAVNLFDFLV